LTAAKIRPLQPTLFTMQTIATRACQISEQGEFDPKTQEPLSSPCVSVCRMNPERTYCEGCFRTLDDIRAWAQADNAQRRRIWREALARAGVPLPTALWEV
jgi:uncharacterized protein